MKMANFLITCAVVLIGFTVVCLCFVAIKEIWTRTVEIETFKDNGDGKLGPSIQASVETALHAVQQIHRESDSAAISVSDSLEIPFLKPESTALKELEELDIKVKDVSVGSLVKLMRSVHRPSMIVRGTMAAEASATTAVIEIDDGTSEDSKFVVSVAKTNSTEQDQARLVSEITYRLLFQLESKLAGADSMTVGNWRSLQLYTEGLKNLQAFRTAERYNYSYAGKGAQEYLTGAIHNLEEAVQIDPTYDYALYYLGVAYFENRGKEDQAIACFKRLLSDWPTALSFTSEARFYLAYAYGRKYNKEGYEEALRQYGLLRDDLEKSLNSESTEDKLNPTFLLAETYTQMAAVNAHLIDTLRPKVATPDTILSLRPAAEKYFKSVSSLSKNASDFLPQFHDKSLAGKRNDIEWRRDNALGAAETQYAYFDDESKYDLHCETALGYYRSALDKGPGNYNTLQNIARILKDNKYSKRDLEQSETLFAQTAKMKPDDYYAHDELGKIYEEQWQNANGTEKHDFEEKMINEYSTAASLGSKHATKRLQELRDQKLIPQP
jgi:tetratricopeptide (TPR) repeat protein